MDAAGARPTTSGAIHQTAGPLTFLGLTAGMFLLSLAFRHDGGWRPFYGASLALSLAMLAAFLATFLSFVADSGTLGIAQRLALATALTWMLLVAARLRATSPGNADLPAGVSPSLHRLRTESAGRRKRMLRIEEEQIYPVPLSEGFAYITDLNNWGDYWPNFVRLVDPAGARWSKPGDTVSLVLMLLNRERELTMTLQAYKPDMLVTYLSRQTGLPDALHERHFRAAPGGFEYRLVVTFAPRPGLAGLLDRSLVRMAVTQAARRTIRNLDAVFNRRQPALPVKGD
jgi:hypothetical protein